MLDSVGANNGFEALWELVPFSFVVDWLINTDTMSQLATQATLIRPDITHLTYSEKRSIRWRSLVVLGRASNQLASLQPIGDDYLIADGSEGVVSSYTRYAGRTPGWTDDGFLPGANLIHAADAAALFVNFCK